MAYTLDGANGQAIAFENNSHGGYAQGRGTLRASGGDYGGGSENIIVEPLAYGMDLSQKAEGIGFKEEQAACLACGTHGGAGMNVLTTPTYWNGEQMTGTLTVNNAGGSQRMPDKDHFHGILQNYAVRRLTPLECERLQGFPDFHTDITYKNKPASDSARYKALGNSVAIPCVEYVAEGIAQFIPNGIGGSLFDGIGGFPLAFGRYGINFVWASEIEDFCIEVTKVRFGGE